MEPESDSLLVCGSRRRLLIGRFPVLGFQNRHLVGTALGEQLENEVVFARVERFALAL